MIRFVYYMVGLGRDITGSFSDRQARARVGARVNSWVKPVLTCADNAYMRLFNLYGQWKTFKVSTHRKILHKWAKFKRLFRMFIRYLYKFIGFMRDLIGSVYDKHARKRIRGRMKNWFGFGSKAVSIHHNAAISGAMERMKSHRLEIGSFISIGAGSGDDSHMVHQMLCPEADLLMIEAQDTHIENLKMIREQNPKEDFIICAAASEDGEVTFNASAPTGGVVSSEMGAKSITVPARAIDSLVRERNMPGPYFLKFDTHGVELDILEGTAETLLNTQLIMMECYNFRMGFVDGKNLTFYEMCSFLETKGFRCVDISDPLFRPNDLALWQMHLYFIRSDDPVFRSSSYAAPARSA